MILAAGQALSTYEIIAPVGSGGMGEVYRARDSRLDREVAIKVFTEDLADDEERLLRIGREARALASLNHSNVAQIHGIDRIDDTSFLVLEFVPGETLEERLSRGPLPLDEAIDVCRQIADGIEAAHEAGVIHRDLKPANVRITPDGTVKVLDFGLAKPFTSGRAGAAERGDALSTEEGRLVGTPAYMAPEQARGRAIDRRVDVWALGCLLFECLTAKPTFPGDTVPDVLASILEKEPDWSALPPSTPALLRDVLARCLVKDPKGRLRDVGDVGSLIAGAGAAVSADEPLGPELQARLRRSRLAVAGLTVALVIAGILAGVTRFGGADEPPPTTMWRLQLPADAELGWMGTSANFSKLGGGSPLLAISPDGRRVAFCVDYGDSSEIRIHELGAAFDSRPVPGTESGRAPFFSYGGEWLGFFADDALQIVSVDGGSPRRVCGVVSPNFAACWMPDDRTIVYSTNAGLSSVLENGEERRDLASPRSEQGEVEYSSPSPLPSGDGVLFTVSTGTAAHVAVLDFETGEVRTVVTDGTNAHQLPGGPFVFADDGEIRSVAFDPTAGGVADVSAPVLGGIFTTPSAGGCVITHYAMSREGTLVYAPGVSPPPRGSLHWVDREGTGSAPIVGGDGFWEHPRLSKDGSRVCFDILNDQGVKDVFVFELVQKKLTRLTQDGTSVMSAWTPGGEVTVRSTHRQNEIRNFSLTGEDVRIVATLPARDEALFADCWSPDGSTVFLTRKGSDGRSIWSCAGDGEEPVMIVGPENDARFSAISPNGEWLAYTENELGRNEVFVRARGMTGPRVMVSVDGGAEPLWSEDGATLFYRRQQEVYAVTVKTDPILAADRPEQLFPGGDQEFDRDPGGHHHYDYDPFNDRFLMILNERTAPTGLHVVRNWADALTPP